MASPPSKKARIADDRQEGTLTATAPTTVATPKPTSQSWPTKLPKPPKYTLNTLRSLNRLLTPRVPVSDILVSGRSGSRDPTHQVDILVGTLYIDNDHDAWADY